MTFSSLNKCLHDVLQVAEFNILKNFMCTFKIWLTLVVSRSAPKFYTILYYWIKYWAINHSFCKSVESLGQSFDNNRYLTFLLNFRSRDSMIRLFSNPPRNLEVDVELVMLLSKLIRIKKVYALNSLKFYSLRFIYYWVDSPSSLSSTKTSLQLTSSH